MGYGCQRYLTGSAITTVRRLQGSGRGAGHEEKPMVAVDNLSLQLYTVRYKLEEDFDATLARIAEIGFTKVEPFGIPANWPTGWPKRCPSTDSRRPPRTPACSRAEPRPDLRGRHEARHRHRHRPARRPGPLAVGRRHQGDRRGAEPGVRRGGRARHHGRLPQPPVRVRDTIDGAHAAGDPRRPPERRTSSSRSTPTGASSAAVTSRPCSSKLGQPGPGDPRQGRRRHAGQQGPDRCRRRHHRRSPTSWPRRRRPCAWSSWTTSPARSSTPSRAPSSS